MWSWLENRTAGVAILLKGNTRHHLQHKEIVAVRLLQASLEANGSAFELLAVCAPANKEPRCAFFDNRNKNSWNR